MEEEEIKDETLEKTEQEQDSDKTEEPSKTETEKEPDWKAKADAMYAKYKAETEKTKELSEKVKTLSEKKTGEFGDLDDLADRLSALQGLDASERGRLLKEAKLQNRSLEEARKSDDFKFWRSAYRAKLEKDKAPEPSTKQQTTSVNASDLASKFRNGTIKKDEFDLLKKDPEAFDDFLRNVGWSRDYTPRRPGEGGIPNSIRPPGV